MNGKQSFRIGRLVLILSFVLYPAIIHGQSSNAEMQAFQQELNIRIYQAKTYQANLSFEHYQKTLLDLLDRKRFYDHESQPSDQKQTEERPTIEDRSEKPYETKRAVSRDSLRFLDYIILIIGLSALIATLAFFGQQIRHHLIVDAEYEAAQSAEETPVTERAALDQAEKFEAGRDFRAALRSIYLAALLHLHERGVLSYGKSLTNREYLRELKVHPALHNALRPVVYTFDDVWYGYKPCNSETVVEYRRLLQKVYEACS